MKKQLLMKTFLVAVSLLVGTSAWGLTITYDFKTAAASGGITASSLTKGELAGQNNGTNIYYPTELYSELGNRFAFQYREKNSNTNAWAVDKSRNGLWVNCASGIDDYMSIMSLKEGDKITITIATGKLKFSNVVNVTYDNAGNPATPDAWSEVTSNLEYTVKADGKLDLQAMKYGNGGNAHLAISKIVIVTSSAETMTAPSIASEANGSARTVTITDGASNLLAPVTTYYTTDGTDPTKTSTKYTTPFDVNASCTIKAITISNSSAATESTVTSQYIDLDAVDVPTAAITAVDGINRTVTFSCTTEGAALSYSTDNGANYTAGTSLIISANTNIKVKATKGLASAESENMAFEAGTEIVLNTPTWTKTGYSAGVSTVTLADNQSDKLLSPVSTIKYQINDGDEQTYSAAISVNDGETLKYWSVAAGYTNSPEGSVVANAPSTDPIFLNETYNGSDAGITVNTEEVVTTIGGGSTPYYYMYANAAHVSDNLISSTTSANNWMVRSTGIYAGNTINYALRNVKKNDIVTIKVVWGTEHPAPSATDGTLDNWNTISGDTYVFKVTSTIGNFRFSLGRYASIKSIKVQRAPISATIPTSGYGTIASAYALDCANLPGGLKAYQVTGLTTTTVTLEEVKEAVAANTGLILKGTASTAYDIPVVASGTDISSTNKLKAAVTATDIAANEAYILQNGEFHLVTAASSIPAGKAYLLASDVPSPDPARSLNFTFDATAIKAVEGEIQNGEFYNVAGQRVAAPTKGLYIVNGKKIVVK